MLSSLFHSWFPRANMQRFGGDDDPLSRPIQRRETMPARVTGQPVLMPTPVPSMMPLTNLTPLPSQPTRSFQQRMPAPLGPVHGTGAPALYIPYGTPYSTPYYPGDTPQAVPMYYQPHLGVPGPSLVDLSTAPPLDAPASSLPNSPRARSRAYRGPSVRRARARSQSSSNGESRYMSRTPSPQRTLDGLDGLDDSDDFGDLDNLDDDLDRRIERRRVGRDLFNGGEPGDNPFPTIYSFTPSRISRAASTQPRTHSDDEPLENEDETNAGGGDGGGPQRGPDRDHPAPRLSHVFESQYSGDHTLGGSHGAKLTAVMSTPTHHPLFRWR